MNLFKLSVLDRIQSTKITQEIEQEEYSKELGLHCSTCGQETDRQHFRSDWHRYNLKRKLKNLETISEFEFEELQEISSIESEDDEVQVPSKTGSPFVHFNLDKNEELLVYKQVLSAERDADWKSELIALQKPQIWTLLLLASGHFAGAVIDCTSGTPIVHKAFHRYTTRRKQGGAQSSNDKSKGKANSAGAGIRRYNEQALREEIQELLTGWRDYLNDSTRIFLRAPVTMRRTIFFDKTILDTSDSRVRGFPFITKRPTLQELTRCYEELTVVRIQEKVEVIEPSLFVSKSKEGSDQKKVLEKLIEYVQKGKLELLKSQLDIGRINDLFDTSLGTSLLHVASSASQTEIIQFLLENGADPTLHSEKKTTKAYDVAGNKDARDVFRRYMHYHPDQWDYNLAGVPGPLTPEMEEKQAEKERERKRKEKERKKLKKDQQKKDQAALLEAAQNEPEPEVVQNLVKKTVGMQLGHAERQTMGMTPEQKQSFEREKRAMAAEARMRVSQNKCGHCGKSLVGISTFDKSIYRYCSMDCLKVLVFHL